ncbi:OmpA family protein [Halioxenophilus sp. WMMB6]|uniref:OmpA family protein n=1 Tax=Halioxenophilus sp. WMMB6 TaxID=3073815 RepID=UPI00295F4AE9|nr:OmpA family protein [Halioxenophilus sp. WMMB6]
MKPITLMKKPLLIALGFGLLAGQGYAEESNPERAQGWMGRTLDWSLGAVDWAATPLYAEPVYRDQRFGDNTEQQMNSADYARQWLMPDDDNSQGDRLETQQVTEQNINTVKLQNVVPPIYFASGEADIPPSYVALLRDVLVKMKDRANVRLHFVGHTDNARLSPELASIYGDNEGLSRERAGTTAEFFQQALDLPAESISYEGMGESRPIASNSNNAGRAKNRRVEVEVWYDEITDVEVEKEVLVAEQMHRLKVCRVETVCKLTYKAGHDHRAKVRNLVVPLHYDEQTTEISANFLKQIRQGLANLNNKQNVVVRFIGHTDNLPLTGRDARLYGNHESLASARARRVALAVAEALGLPSRAVDSLGKGVDQPIASNATEKGRMLNNRIEVEFWYDDQLQALPDEPQMCPEQSGAETVTRVYDPPSGAIPPVLFDGGQPIVPPGYSQRLVRLMDEVKDKARVRLRFRGYIANERLERRTAAVYGDDVGLSTARARRVMEQVRNAIGLSDEQVLVEGYGYVQTDDVVNSGFVEFDRSRVVVDVLYEELAILDDLDALDITRITREVATQNPFALNLMRITVDGVPVDDPGKSVADVQRCTDVALERTDIQLKYDNLAFKPRLNVTAWPTTIRFQDDFNTSAIENQVRFKLYSNYRERIDHAEVRLFEAGQSSRDEPLAVIPLDANGAGEWSAEQEHFSGVRRHLHYRLRVYNSDGLFDETKAQSLWLVDSVDPDELQAADAERELLTGYGENRLELNNIPLSGGSIQVSGDAIPPGHSVWVAGHPVPLNEQGEFVAEELLPAGLHTVEVAVLDEQGNGELFLRDLELKKNDWFYVGLADITLATDSTNGPAKLVTQDDIHYDNGVSLEGRLAYYANGKFGDNWQLVSSADTREDELDNLFSNFLDKTPDALFRRLDPDYFYPTFGDDSTVEEMAPTQGKFYVKLQKQDDYGLWGNFDVDYSDNSLALVDRTLYGANGHWQSDNVLSFGDERIAVDGFVADPGTVASRDEFRGTGGSLYFLRHEDLLQGSETVRIEVRDPDSGLVVAVKNLVPGLDYELDYLQGRVLLSEPLSASRASEMLVNNDTGIGYQVFLVTRYEYTPAFGELDTLALGGQVHYWLNEQVRLGVNLHSNETDDEDGSLNGFDLTWRKSAATWVKLEAAQSDGTGVTTLASIDGGYSFDNQSVTDENASASAYRLDSKVALEDLHAGLKGQATAYLQSVEAGYAAPGLQTNRDVTQYGGSLAVPVLDNLDMRGKLDLRDQTDGLETMALALDGDYQLNDHWTLSSGLRLDDRTDNSVVVPVTQEEGQRTDLRLQGEYDSLGSWSSYGYLQGTLEATDTREDNNRAGVGGRLRVSKRLIMDGEVSGGDLGTLGRIGSEFLYSDRTSLYTTYAVENERADNGVRSRSGNLVSGFRTRYSDSASVYMEEKYSHGDTPTGLTHSAGIDLAPNDRWNYGFNLDIATLKDWQTSAQTERTAFGANVGYLWGDTTITSALEYRTDDTESATTGLTSERKTWLSKSSLKLQLTDSWRLIGKLNISESQSSLGEFYDGNFTEAVVGYAYRPVSSDRLNALLKYTYFYNLPATDQVTLAGSAVQYVQKSNIFSADITYDLNRHLSLGGKYALRRGELSLDRVDPEFFSSDAYLYIFRTDWHLLHKWDLLIEARLLDLPDAQDQRAGLLAGIYRHVGDHLKVGVGYNATDFSDDLTDLSYDSQGIFINAVGKF